jgi:chemotaxis regulatin CheY-phosphate phosphatase CheZ
VSPTQRTLKHLRDQGYPLVQVVERWNSFARRRIDLFGIIDVVAVGADIVGVQSTSGSNVSARVTKIMESQALPVLRKANIRVLVHGWTKRANGRYELREVDLS